MFKLQSLCENLNYFAQLAVPWQAVSCAFTGTPSSVRESVMCSSILCIIIQQIVTMPIYGQEALNICHPYMTDIQ